MLKNFISETDLLKFTDETCHTCCDLCAELCKCNHCSVLDIEKLFNNECLNCSSDSDDTIDYDWNVDELDMDFSFLIVKNVYKTAAVFKILFID